MDTNKTGKFLQDLRKENNITQEDRGDTIMSNDTPNVSLNSQQELTQRKWSKLSIVGFSVSVVAFIIGLIPSICGLFFHDLINAGDASTPIPPFLMLMLGFIALYGIVWLVSGLVGAASIVMSIVGLTNVVRQGKRGKAFAIIGIVLSAISVFPIGLYLLSL